MTSAEPRGAVDEGPRPGLTEQAIVEFSRARGEPDWLLRFRLRSLESCRQLPSLPGLDPASVDYEAVSHRQTSSASELAAKGVADRITDRVANLGVLFLETGAAVRTHPDLVRRFLGSVAPPEGDGIAAANGALWSGGSFVYVPPNLRIGFPLQADMLEGGRRVGPFERTLVIADEGSRVEFIDGCTSPLYASQSVSAAVAEVVALPGAAVRYIEFQNWTSDVSNFLVKRSRVHRDARVEWLDANIGSRRTVNVPSADLMEPGARADIVSISLAANERDLEVGGEVRHRAARTASRIECRSVLRGGGRATHRLRLRADGGCEGTTAVVDWSSLLLDDRSRCETYPEVELREAGASVTQKGSAERLSEDTLFYLMSRGVTRAEAVNLVVLGFLDGFLREIPMEYSVEFNRLLELELEGALG